NMLLVMDTAGIFHSADSRTGYSDLWEITWERIDCFLPLLREELFKQTVIAGTTRPSLQTIQDPVLQQRLCSPHPQQVSLPPPGFLSRPPPVPVSPAETRTPSRPESPLEPPAASANGSDCSSPTPASTPPMPVPLTTSPPLASSPRSQPPFILQPLASPLQVGVLPMSLPIILNPALIEASSPVPLLPPRPDLMKSRSNTQQLQEPPP
ncbi:hypothetical protein KUCAC02_037007, partial [Chaenocephalus aceratus]